MEVDVALIQTLVVVVVDVVEPTRDNVVVGIGTMVVTCQEDAAARVGRVGIVGGVNGEKR